MIFEALALTACLGVAGLATAAVWSRKDTWMRTAAVLGFFTIVPTIGATVLYTLSHPSPYLPVITISSGEYTVLGVKLVQNEAIYVWLDFGKKHPRYFALPWDNETANKLQDLLNSQRRNVIPGFKMKIPYEFSWDLNPPQFHPLPQPILPIPKGEQPDEPLRHERGA